MSYRAEYTILFNNNLVRYAGLRSRIFTHMKHVLEDPYHNTERLGYKPGQANLRGCRSARIDRNFRLVFVICEECRAVPQCEYCFCEGLPDQMVVFLTIGPHEQAYAMREAEEEYSQSG